jgi:hypothetical protein
MSRISLALVAVVLVVSAMFRPSLVVRAQSTARIEYVAGTTEWACRDFQPMESSAEALRTELVTLGNEG